jgi:hypothetical protein
MHIRDAPKLILGAFGLLRNGDTQHAVPTDESAPLDESDLNKLTGNQRVPLLSLDLEDEQGQLLVQANELTDLDMSREEWLREFHQMRLDDSVQDALNILTTALHNFKYYVLPASDDAKDVKVAAFIADQLGIGRPSFSKYAHFRVLLKTYELALIYGYSAVEIVTDTEGGLAKLVPIHPFHIVDIERDKKGGPKNLIVRGTVKAGTAQVSEYKEVKVPFVKVVYFAHDDDGNLDGRSLLRAAYVPWRIKRAMLRLVNAGYERFLLGIPVLKALAAKPRSGVALPEGWQLEIYTVNSQMPDALPYIIRQDVAIKRAMGVSMASLGLDTTANYKQADQLGKVSREMALRLAREFMDYVNLYLVNRLVFLNFPNLTRYPYLGLVSSAQADPASVLNAFAQMLSAAAGAGGFNEETYNRIAELAPRAIRDLMGFEEDRLLRLVEAARRSVR